MAGLSRGAKPPFYAQQMAATNHQPLLVKSSSNSSVGLDYTATRNEKGDTLVLHIVNYGSSDRSLTLDLQNFDNVGSMCCISLCGTEKGENTPQTPTSISPNERSIEPGEKVTLRAYSYIAVFDAHFLGCFRDAEKPPQNERC